MNWKSLTLQLSSNLVSDGHRVQELGHVSLSALAEWPGLRKDLHA